MSEKVVIKGGNKLEGEVEIRGSKNGAAAVIAACLLTKEECMLPVSFIRNMASGTPTVKLSGH